MATVTRDVPTDVVICEYHDVDVAAVDTVKIIIGGKTYLADVCQACYDEIVGPARAVKRRRPRPAAARRAAARKSKRPATAKAKKKTAASNGNGRSNGHAKRAPRTRKVNLSEIRQWARDNGYEVADKGRVPADIVNAWNASVKA